VHAQDMLIMFTDSASVTAGLVLFCTKNYVLNERSQHADADDIINLLR